jgi:uncharacterized protein (DUF952 family)
MCDRTKQLRNGEGSDVMVGGNRGQGPQVTLHLVPEEVWLTQNEKSHYLPDGFSSEGFIHCTHGDRLVIEVGNRYYRDDPRAYLVLEIELERVTAPVIYEDDQRRYPHIYGPLERQAVRRVCRIERAADGTFVAIGEPAPEQF